MKLSISNIAWGIENNESMYSFMSELGYEGLEIAPTKFFPDQPYDHWKEFHLLCNSLKTQYNIAVSSMQSILYGMKQNLFESHEAVTLLAYLDKASAFGEAGGGCNLVFGCPQNRSIPEGRKQSDAIPFFEKAATSALSHNCVLALEANPPMYGTNFVNTTKQAFEFAREVPGLKVNLDFGTIIDRGEELNDFAEDMYLVNHIHISEPGLVPIKHRKEHKELASLLSQLDYSGYVSIEMKETDIQTVKNVMEYIAEIFA
ncbi:MAG: sugar phosphate isomerase/epimerase [Oscillospiraceae bacterium]|nr:sugar phosphate isomerase/epimerase [Oscillospiraceae bacterium]